jgi:imidazoleglycerol phosphate synthase glutamine amidotransferase subunit HisH
LTERCFGGHGIVAAGVKNSNVRFQFHPEKSELLRLRILDTFMKRTR